jgi:hypothetical protein
MANRFGQLFIVATMLVGCGHAIEGQWAASGEVRGPSTTLFDFSLNVQSTKRAAAILTPRGSAKLKLAVSKLRVGDQSVSFVFKGPRGPNRTVPGFRPFPLTFKGTLGAHIITGKIYKGGREVGMWRGFRVGE